MVNTLKILFDITLFAEKDIIYCGKSVVKPLQNPIWGRFGVSYCSALE